MVSVLTSEARAYTPSVRCYLNGLISRRGAQGYISPSLDRTYLYYTYSKHNYWTTSMLVKWTPSCWASQKYACASYCYTGSSSGYRLTLLQAYSILCCITKDYQPLKGITYFIFLSSLYETVNIFNICNTWWCFLKERNLYLKMAISTIGMYFLYHKTCK